MKLDQTFKIKVNGEAKTLKMSFGLLNQICKQMGDVDDALAFGVNNELRDAVLIELLAERDENGVITKAPNLFYLDVAPADVTALLDWAGAHALDFFLAAIEKAKVTGEGRQERIKALQS